MTPFALPPRTLKTTAAAAVLSVLGALAVLEGVGYATSRDAAGPPHFNRAAHIKTHHLPNITLIDHEGRSHRFYDGIVAGRIVAINFMYTACSKTCTLSSQTMARLQDDLTGHKGPQIELYSISLDPEHDTPEALAAYRLRQGGKDGWTFLTAQSVAEITELRRRLGIYEPDSTLDGDLTNHTGMIVLGNEPLGRWSMVPALVPPARILQAVDRIRQSPENWPNGDALVEGVPRHDSDRSLVP